MKTLVKLLSLIFLFSFSLNAQVAVNTDGSSPDASAMLDIKSSNMGLLIPRLTDTQMNGIAAPATGLMVYNTDQNNYYFYNGSTWSFVAGSDDGDWTISGNDIYSTVSGNVGIGTSSPGDHLHIYGSGQQKVKVQTTGGDGTTVGYALMGAGTNAQWSIETNKSTTGGATDNLFFYKNSGTSGTKMVISDEGNVGIGTLTPSSKLHIMDIATSTDEDAINIGIDGEHTGSINFYDDDAVANQWFKMSFNAQNEDLKFHSDNKDNILYMTNNGSVGIGTNNPTEELHVDGSIRMVDGNQQAGYVMTSDANGVASWADNSSLSLWAENGGNVYRSSGNVGIGTNNPTSNLHLRSNGSLSIVLEADANNSGEADQPQLVFSQDGGAVTSQIGYFNSENIFSIIQAYNDDMYFYTNNETRMTIDNDGNVGVGTNNPSSELNIVGKVKIDLKSDNANTLEVQSLSQNISLDANHQIGGCGTTSGDRWQSFTIINTGELSSVEASINTNNSSVGTMYIYEGTGTGGTLLTSEPYNFPASGGVQWKSISLSSGVILNAGQVYTMRWSSADWSQQCGAGTYSGGTAETSGKDRPFKIFLRIPNNNGLVFTVEGNLGIGIGSPSCPLEINGSNNLTASYGYLNSSGNTGTASGNNSYSIRASNRIMASEFNAVSDQRIKTNIKSSQINTDLNKINKLRLTNYTYIDHISKGNQEQKGFIAQEVEKIIPEAVNISSNYIPDIFSLASNIQKEGNAIIIELPKEHTLKEGDLVRIISPEGQLETEVVSVNSENTFTIHSEIAPESLFVYGKKVDDFRAINYNYIFSTGIGAIQALSKQNDELNKRIENLETINNGLTSRLDNIEGMVQDLVEYNKPVMFTEK